MRTINIKSKEMQARAKRIVESLDRIDRMIKEHKEAAERYRIVHMEKLRKQKG